MVLRPFKGRAVEGEIGAEDTIFGCCRSSVDADAEEVRLDGRGQSKILDCTIANSASIVMRLRRAHCALLTRRTILLQRQEEHSENFAVRFDELLLHAGVGETAVRERQRLLERRSDVGHLSDEAKGNKDAERISKDLVAISQVSPSELSSRSQRCAVILRLVAVSPVSRSEKRCKMRISILDAEERATLRRVSEWRHRMIAREGRKIEQLGDFLKCSLSSSALRFCFKFKMGLSECSINVLPSRRS